jgi:hypothetical protein
MRSTTVGNPPTLESANVGRVEIENHFIKEAAQDDLLLVTGEQNTAERPESRYSGLGLFHGESKLSLGGIENDSLSAAES